MVGIAYRISRSFIGAAQRVSVVVGADEEWGIDKISKTDYN
jgi:hypothetical protein